jgi:hypothetical protein
LFLRLYCLNVQCFLCWKKKVIMACSTSAHICIIGTILHFLHHSGTGLCRVQISVHPTGGGMLVAYLGIDRYKMRPIAPSSKQEEPLKSTFEHKTKSAQTEITRSKRESLTPHQVALPTPLTMEYLIQRRLTFPSLR